MGRWCRRICRALTPRERIAAGSFRSGLFRSGLRRLRLCSVWAGLSVLWLWRKAVRLAADFIRSWSRRRLGGLSAEIAFFAVLSVFPAVIMFASVLGSLDSLIGQNTATSVKDWVGEWITDVFGTDNTLKGITDDLFDQPRSGLITVAMMMGVYLTSRGFTAAVRSLEVAYASKRRRGWLSARITGIVLTVCTLCVASLTAAAVVVGPLLGTGSGLAERVGAGWAFAVTWAWIRWPVLFFVVVAWITTVYRVVPRHGGAWRAELPGAVLCAVWWVLVSSGFQAYLDFASGGVNVVFGILGGALSLLLWLYLMSMGFLAGAVLNCVMARRRRSFGALFSWWLRLPAGVGGRSRDTPGPVSSSPSERGTASGRGTRGTASGRGTDDRPSDAEERAGAGERSPQVAVESSGTVLTVIQAGPREAR